MKIFSAAEYSVGSPAWWELRRGLVTASVADMILTPKTCKPSASQVKLISQLIMDIVNPSPNWFTERMIKAPNQWIQDGIAREAESKRWYSLSKDVDVQDVGFCLADCGRYGASPDALVGEDGCLEMKNPRLDTMADYLLDPMELEDAYRCQCHFQLIVTGRAWCDLCAYAPPLEPVVVRVVPGLFTQALRAELETFLCKFAEAKKRLGIPEHVTEEGEILS